MLLLFRFFWKSGGDGGSATFPLLILLIGDQEVHEEDDERKHVPQQAPTEHSGKVTSRLTVPVTDVNALHTETAKLEDLCLGDVVLPPRRVPEGREQVVPVHEDVNVAITGQ